MFNVIPGVWHHGDSPPCAGGKVAWGLVEWRHLPVKADSVLAYEFVEGEMVLDKQLAWQ